MTTASNPPIFANKSFVLLVLSAIVSLIGDQMTLIALPWLMMTLTADPLAVSGMMALLALPRAVLLLFGGALADKLNPVRLLRAMRLVSFGLLAGLAALAASGALESWHLYPIAFAFGLCSSLGLPAGASLTPRILPAAQLGSGNAMLMMAGQIALLIGPMTAGLLIAQQQDGPASLSAFALIFALDAATFLFSFGMLFFIRLVEPAPTGLPAAGLLARLADGARYVVRDRPLAFYLLYVAAITLFVSGPLIVGIPFLVSQELAGSAFRYGAFFVVMNLGTILAAGLAMMTPTPSGTRLVPIALLIDVLIGALMIAFVNILQSWLAFLILFAVGLMMGYVQVTMTTRIQRRADPAYLGRVMAFMMLAMLGVAPFSTLLAGFVVDRLSAKSMFEIVGALMAVLPLLCLFSRDMRRLGEDAPADAASSPQTAIAGR